MLSEKSFYNVIYNRKHIAILNFVIIILSIVVFLFIVI